MRTAAASGRRWNCGTAMPSTGRTLYQKGMRVLVEGRTVRDEWEDADENERVTFKIEARRVGILPYRLEAVTLGAKPAVRASDQASAGGCSNRQTPAMHQWAIPWG
jgi:single-stranded DNA-binding protein